MPFPSSRTWLPATAVCGLLVAIGLNVPCTCHSAEISSTKRPNVILIMADDHAAHAISAYGSRINKTPRLDQIAAQGIRFTHCFVTNSICTPSRAAILTGKYAHLNGVPVFNRFNGDQPTLPKYLQQAGYHTGIVGKWHLGSDPTGFDYWNILPGQGVYQNPELIEMGTRKTHAGYVTDIITDLAIQFLDVRSHDKPFFLMVHHKAPHREWAPKSRDAERWANVEVPEPITFDDDYRTRSAAAGEATMRIDRDLNRRDLKYPQPPPDLSGPDLTTWYNTVDEELDVPFQGPLKKLSGRDLKRWKYQRYMRDYLACIDSVDKNVGRLIDYLDQHNLADNTLLIYTSDQGFFLGDHNWFDKRFMYEESLRMPLLIRWPAVIKPSSTSSDIVLNVDFAPTLAAACGLTVPADMQGDNFLPILQGKKPENWRKSMYYRYYHYPLDHHVQPHYGVRTERYKLIYFDKIKAWELYDLNSDPHELHNLYDQPAQAQVIEELKNELERLRNELHDEDQFADKLPPYGV